MGRMLLAAAGSTEVAVYALLAVVTSLGRHMPCSTTV